MSKIPGKALFAPIGLLFRVAMRHGGIHLTRAPLLAAYVFRYLLLEPLRLAEIFLYDKKIQSHKLTHAPIFILGHWRSGTSYIQSLVCMDKGMTSSTIFRSLFADCFYLAEPWLKGILNFFCKVFKIPYSIQRMPMDLNFPAEADMALCSLCSERSYTWGHLFPKKFSQWVDEQILFRDEHQGGAWAKDYDYFIRKLSLKSNGKRVVIKSPGDTGRIAQLLQLYPTALFIYVYRSPVSVFYSNQYFWKILLKQNSLQKLSDIEVDELIIRNYRQIVSNYLKHRDLIPSNQLAELQFEEVLKDPTGQLAKAYHVLGLGQLPEKDLQSFLLRHGSHKIEPYLTSYEMEQRLRREWPFAFESGG